MTHEPECPRMTCYQRRDELPCDNHECLCPIARAAYQRGREDAAKAVSTETCHTKECDFDRAEGLICYCGYETSIAAARGDGEQT